VILLVKSADVFLVLSMFGGDYTEEWAFLQRLAQIGDKKVPNPTFITGAIVVMGWFHSPYI